MTQVTIDFLKTTYPEEITKEQFYRICHVSKRTASYLLESGIIPCRKTDKKTRKYKILLADVIQYLKQQEIAPVIFMTPENHNKKGYGECATNLKVIMLSDDRKQHMRDVFSEKLAQYDDVITPKDVAQILGYTTKSIIDWCAKGVMESFLINNSYKIPKEYLMTFMLSNRCLTIAHKSEKHKRILNEALYDHVSNTY